MKLKHFLVALVCLVCYSYSYSEVVYQKSPNVVVDGLTWTMTNILPQYTGLTVTGVTYGYTVNKRTEDPFAVTIQNQNKRDGGYVFRQHDDWTGLPGTTLVRTVPTNSDISLWGPGEIVTSGFGTLSRVSVNYNYRYDTCNTASPTDPRCPNYKYRFDTATDPLSLDYVQAYLQTKATLETDETRESNRLFTENAATQKSPKLNNASANRILTQQAQQQAQSLLALNNIPGFASYSQQIPGGVYTELIKYPLKVLPDAKSSRLLSASQERLHNRLVDLQYSPRSP